MNGPDARKASSVAAEFQLDEAEVARRALAERVRVFTDRAVAGALSSPFGTLLLAGILGPVAGWDRAAIWLVIINLGELLILGYGYRYRAATRREADSVTWARRQMLANAVTGLAWGSSVWVMAVAPDSAYYLFNICVLVGVSALCVQIVSAFSLGMLLFSLGVLLPPLAHVVWTGHPQALELGAGLAILFLLELYYGHFARRQLIEGLDAVQRGQALVEQLSRLRSDLSRSNHALEQKNADLAEAFERLNELATHDELTGAFNRRVMVERLELQAVYKARYGTLASVAMLDLDHCKRINDSYGHSVGDLALKALVRALDEALREGDILARFGGEEFLILLPLAGREAAAQTAERLRLAVAGIALEAGETRIALRASLGVAELKAGENVAGWLHRADQALYRAKDEGRNRVVVAD